MKIIKYKQRIIVPSSDEQERDREIFYEIQSPWNSQTEEIAKREAYNGEYTIEDDGKPEPIIPPTNDELAAENKLLKQQVSALTDQQSFYEDCIAEMATVVYA